MSELLEYAKMHPPPEDSHEVLATESYLRALNNIFERTLLGKKTRIFQPDGSSMQRLEKGFSYFREWADELVEKGEFDSGVESKKFIAWQVCSCDCLYYATVLLSKRVHFFNIQYTHSLSTETDTGTIDNASYCI
jgi:hypothetical protein